MVLVVEVACPEVAEVAYPEAACSEVACLVGERGVVLEALQERKEEAHF